MPKRSTPARGAVQRTKPKAQKSFELVRPTSQVQELEEEELVTTPEETTTQISDTAVEPEASANLDALPSVPKRRVRTSNVATEVAPTRLVPAKNTKSVAEEVAEVAPKDVEEAPVVAQSKSNAATRLAANKTAQRTRRNNAMLITAEHYSYVRRDLVFIAVLAAIMFLAIIVIYFTGIAV